MSQNATNRTPQIIFTRASSCLFARLSTASAFHWAACFCVTVICSDSASSSSSSSDESEHPRNRTQPSSDDTVVAGGALAFVVGLDVEGARVGVVVGEMVD